VTDGRTDRTAVSNRALKNFANPIPNSNLVRSYPKLIPLVVVLRLSDVSQAECPRGGHPGDVWILVQPPSSLYAAGMHINSEIVLILLLVDGFH